MKKKYQGRYGAICLEAAVILPFVLIMTVQMISLIYLERAEIVLKGALDRTADEISLLTPFCSRLAEWQQEDEKCNGKQGQEEVFDPADPDISVLQDLIEELWPDLKLQSLVKDAALDYITSALLGQVIQYRLDYWLEKSCEGQQNMISCFLDRKIFMDWKLAERQVWICLSWQYATPMGKVKKVSYAIVPIWIGNAHEAEISEKGKVWRMDNFSRGKYLRRIFGANLPDDFPVIAAINQDEVLSIKSIDLTAPTYLERGNLRRVVLARINDLAEFREAHYDRGGNTIDLHAGMIRSRRLLLVVPENSGAEWQDDVLDELKKVAAAMGISTDIVRYGQSTRYQAEE